MKELIRTIRKWRNSVGILLGKEFKPNKKIKILISEEKFTKAGDIFGTLKMKTPTEKLMKEIDKELR